MTIITERETNYQEKTIQDTNAFNSDRKLIPTGYKLENGYLKVEKQAKEDTYWEEVTSTYLSIDSIYKDFEDDIHQVRLLLTDTLGEERLVVTDMESIVKTNDIISLSKYDTDIDQSNAMAILKYLKNFRREFAKEIPRESVIGRLGWFDGGFMLPYEYITTKKSDLKFQPKTEGEQSLAEGFKIKGTSDSWFESVFSLIEDKPYVVAFVLGSLASIVLNKFSKIDPFIIEIAGSTSQGKTKALDVAISVWGNPDVLRDTWNGTKVAVEQKASFLHSLPIFLDDTKKADDRLLEKAIYNFTNAKEKSRGGLKGSAKSRTWENIMLSTGETKLTNIAKSGGVAGRVLPFHCSPLGGYNPDLANNIENKTMKHYGAVGKEFATFVQRMTENDIEQYEILFDGYRKQFESSSKGIGVISRLSKYMALLCVTADIVNRCFRKNISVDQLEYIWSDMLENNEDVDKHEMSFNYVVEQCRRNTSKFAHEKGETLTNGYWGDWKRTDNEYTKEIAIFPSQLKDLLVKEGYEVDTTLVEWKKKGYIKTGVKGNTKNVRLLSDNSQKKMIVLDISKVESGE